MVKSWTLLATSVLATASFGAAATCDPGETVIKFSHVTNTDKHPKGIAVSLLEKRVNQEMNGKVCIQVFPNSTLYDDDKVLEALLNGDVQLAAPSLSKFEKFTKKYRIFDLPFLFQDVDAVDRFQNSESGETLKNAMQRRGLQGLAFWHNGMKQMSANKPLLTPEDAKGLKFRVQASDVLVAQFEQLDANPQKMSFKEVYGGLQTKVIDGQENTWSNIYGKKFFEVQDGITETNHGILDYLLVTSNEFWKALPADQRQQLNTIIQEVTLQRNAESSQVNLTNKNNIIEAGGEVRALTAEQRQQWVTALKPVWKKFEKDIGSDLIEAALASNQK
ncbi:DctP family TRAP transporter solute-binding subunit [Vibrio ostreicida]|uniref:DctP family TRAP transporter solute-binding subunit n=1 Tax=Vibrio ostreicida TaxID=526588 RepID=A0ABT8BUD3_9VIBR|nr:DctP family TRAP transporter solute-binding subunit [Vibrio ostreicida]MDN3610563.1 DctP family TRAP transporter solute-binding subunit [Vibrio ostreicida]NPD07437.1 DctP family TRAP transporter solute-binding subunit [Vibrio ostreicida]